MLGLPNGVDTVAAPIKLLMSPYPSGGVVSAFTATYTFHVEDAVNFVDGICYIGVYTDTTYFHG
ncbi:hypothetical protein, partial [Salmonella enterica]|uniref:hypothetical protein n=1 Tax=Salmonella enterica TaxID=28901 RepID=UPI003D2B7A46